MWHSKGFIDIITVLPSIRISILPHNPLASKSRHVPGIGRAVGEDHALLQGLAGSAAVLDLRLHGRRHHRAPELHVDPDVAGGGRGRAGGRGGRGRDGQRLE